MYLENAFSNLIVLLYLEAKDSYNITTITFNMFNTGKFVTCICIDVFKEHDIV